MSSVTFAELCAGLEARTVELGSGKKKRTIAVRSLEGWELALLNGGDAAAAAADDSGPGQGIAFRGQGAGP